MSVDEQVSEAGAVADRKAPSVHVPSGLDWQVALAEALLANGVTVATFVPDSRLHGVLAELSTHGVAIRSLAREEECVAYALGQRLAGGRPVVLLQSSGLGNSLNALATAAVPYRLGIPLVISMRGGLGETNPSQVPMGRATPALLDALGIQSFSLRDTDRAGVIASGVCGLAFGARECAAVLLEPELGGGRETR